MNCGVAESAMTMRAEVHRSAAGTDPYGHQKPTTGNMPLVADGVPCFVWLKTTKEVVEGKELAIESITAYFRPEADLQRDDRIEQVKDRRDRVVFAGPLIVDTIVEKFAGARLAFKEVTLRRARG